LGLALVGPEVEDEVGPEPTVAVHTDRICDLYTPVDEEVVEVNRWLNDSPEKVSEDPYGDSWIIKLRSSSEGDLLFAEEYEKLWRRSRSG